MDRVATSVIKDLSRERRRTNHATADAHDDTLVDWFLSLAPTERLAELESRIAFFNAASRDGDSELSSDSRDP